jgi:hypothetical protein
MLEIIKYQLKGRKKSILLLLAIVGALNAIAFGVELSGAINSPTNVNSALGFWIVIACMVTSISTVVMFFVCSTGHVNELLYKDSNYLMLTVPRHGWEILGGRFIAGFIEFLAYFIAACFLATIHVSIAAPMVSNDGMNFFRMFGFLYGQVFVVNFISVAQVSLIGLLIFVITGTFITFAVVASRSFVKNKGIATAVSIVVFITVLSQAAKWGTALSEKLNMYWGIQPKINFPEVAKLNANGLQITTGDIAPILVPIAPFVFFLALAVVLFAASSWLMEKKVEL